MAGRDIATNQMKDFAESKKVIFLFFLSDFENFKEEFYKTLYTPKSHRMKLFQKQQQVLALQLDLKQQVLLQDLVDQFSCRIMY